MASLLFKDRKGVLNLSCTSPASAAVCTTLERRPMVSPSVGRAAGIYSSRNSRTEGGLNPKKQTASNAVLQSIHNTRRKSTEKQRSFEAASPACSSRYLLKDSSPFNLVPDAKGSVEAVLSEKSVKYDSEIISHDDDDDDDAGGGDADALRTCSARQDQVVVLRVSLHCKGCEGKVRKHISKMEGVTSFAIDMAAKKVTVKGNITPLRVLSSVSKVRKAQFWPSQQPPPLPPPPSA